jgi:predicted nicotinamide N-methyase
VSDPSAFVRAETILAAPPLVPEIRLHLASEVLPLWQATEETLTRRGLPPPYWAFAWPGGQAIARYVLDNPALLSSARVLDFAAGSGLAAIAAAKAGAVSIVAAEIDAFALAAIGLNAMVNGVTIETIGEDVVGRPSAWDIVLAGDVCYERPMAERVARWFAALAAAGTEVLMADPGRAYLPREGLVELARYDVPTSLDLEDRRQRETVVWRWQKNATQS